MEFRAAMRSLINGRTRQVHASATNNSCTSTGSLLKVSTASITNGSELRWAFEWAWMFSCCSCLCCRSQARVPTSTRGMLVSPSTSLSASGAVSRDAAALGMEGVQCKGAVGCMSFGRAYSCAMLSKVVLVQRQRAVRQAGHSSQFAGKVLWSQGDNAVA